MAVGQRRNKERAYTERERQVRREKRSPSKEKVMRLKRGEYEGDVRGEDKKTPQRDKEGVATLTRKNKLPHKRKEDADSAAPT